MHRCKRILSLFLTLLFFGGCASTDDTVSLPVAEPSEQALTVQGEQRSQKVFYGEQGGNTLSGLSALSPLSYTVSDPENAAGYKEDAVDHYFGKAKNGQVHAYSQSFQQIFEREKLDAVVYDAKSQEKRIYLTFDCGYENGNTAKILDVLKEKQVPAAFFCTLHEIKSAPELIARMIKEGHIVGNHSVSHADFTTISRTGMAEELMGFDTYMRENFGYSSLYFRFPEGRYNLNAVQLANSLGFSCIFWSAAYSDWDTSKQKGAQYAFEQVTNQLHPGMILLLHSVSADNAAAMGQIIDHARGEGYVFCALTDLPA